MPKALEGMKILDFTQFEAGTSCTEYLGFLGADVIKIEPPGRGEPGRTILRNKEEVEKGYDSWYYISLNANKRAITLNLKSEKGLAMFKEMVKKADVVVSNFAPGTMDEWGVGYEVLSKINPKLVYALNSGFGMGGPYSNYLAFDNIAKAAGGTYSNTGLQSTPPLNPGPTIGDTGSGVHMAVGVLAAYVYAQKTGKGQIVDQSMSDACINLNRCPMAVSGTIGGDKPAPRAMAPDVMKCKGDGPNDYALALFVTDRQYESLMKAAGREDMLTPELKSNFAARWARTNDIRIAVEEWTKTKTKMEVFETLAPLGIPCAPILDTMEVLNNPHFNQRGTIVEMNHPLRGKFKMPGCPVQLSESPVDYKVAPLLGQHNEEVYADWLGLSKQAVANLKAEKVI